MTRRLRTVTKIFKNMYLSGRTAVQFQFQSGTLVGDHRMPLPRPPPSPCHAVFISRFLPAARAAAAAAAAAASPLDSPPWERIFFFSLLFLVINQFHPNSIHSKNWRNCVRAEKENGSFRGRERMEEERRRGGERETRQLSRFARISGRLDDAARQVSCNNCRFEVQLHRSRARFTVQDDLNDPGPSQPGAKCRQTVVAGSARCIFMILFFLSLSLSFFPSSSFFSFFFFPLITHRGKEEVSSAGRNALKTTRRASRRDRAHTNRLVLFDFSTLSTVSRPFLFPPFFFRSHGFLPIEQTSIERPITTALFLLLPSDRDSNKRFET